MGGGEKREGQKSAGWLIESEGVGMGVGMCGVWGVGMGVCVGGSGGLWEWGVEGGVEGGGGWEGGNVPWQSAKAQKNAARCAQRRICNGRGRRDKLETFSTSLKFEVSRLISAPLTNIYNGMLIAIGEMRERESVCVCVCVCE